MPVHPVLMVLYTNDAVEVRYSDGSRLHILPCGTSFSHHVVPDDTHPAHGMERVQQRCQYVTSKYRHMLLAALDFRNRFAERPYLGQDLMEADQVVSLYARIKEIAWPKLATGQNTELLQDGSVRVTSDDEFGSLILSPHRRDFTVCYLSLLSQEKSRNKSKVRKTGCSSQTNVAKECYDHPKLAKLNALDRLNLNKTPPPTGQLTNQIKGHLNISPFTNQANEDLNISPITQASCQDSPQALSNASGSPVTPQNFVKDDVAKFRPFSTPTEGMDEPEKPFDNPAVFSDYYHLKKGHKVRSQCVKQDNLDGSYEGPSDGHECASGGKRNMKSNNTNGKYTDSNWTDNDRKQTVLNQGIYSVDSYVCEKSKESGHRHSKADGTLVPQSSKHYTDDSLKFVADSSRSSAESVGSDGLESSNDQQVRCQYCWVTRHVSSDECPVTWSHVVKMARTTAEEGIQGSTTVSDNNNKPRPTDAAGLRKIKKDNCVMSTVPVPLALSCPGQHLHKSHGRHVYQDSKDPVGDPSTLHLGHLKVLLVDGIIYRIVRLAAMKVIEVYPGDGSVLVSQGLSAHFFQHIIPHGDKLEERTYSVKCPPQPTHTSTYSIRSLLQRASRFMVHAQQEEKCLPASAGLCCWKHEEMVIIEPLPSTVLEDSTIPGYGKFTALSNGQVRIVFQDRTALDMTCDFSRRVQTCLEHSVDSVGQTPVMAPDSTAGMCRLLLPNGQYQMVDVTNPGVYKRYVAMATEWAAWVNTSPAQREAFYKDRSELNSNMSVQRELQKISTFNYIVENTVLKKDNPSQGSAFKPYPGAQQAVRPGILRKSDQNKNNFASEPPCESKSVQIRCSVTQSHTPSLSQNHMSMSTSQNSTSNITHNSILPTSMRPCPIGKNFKFSPPIGQNFKSSDQMSNISGPSSAVDVSRLSTMQGFNAVREALLKTSSAIKDLDGLLDRK